MKSVSKLILYGARSGIQKAVRRGDVSLAKACFDLLWEETEHRQWLKQRLLSIVIEDSWTMLGEFALLLEGDTLEKQDWLRFLLTLTIARKNQDCGWGWWVAMNGRLPEVDNPEFRIVRTLLKSAEEAGGAHVFSMEDILERIPGHRELTEYEMKAYMQADRRRKQWGLGSDKWMGLFCMAVIHLRGLDRNAVAKMLEEQKALYSGTKLERLTTLPLFCFDMHTRPGKMALGAWKKQYVAQYNISPNAVGGLVFHLMSAITMPHVTCPVVPMGSTVPRWNEQAWHTLSKNELVFDSGFSSREDMERFWNNAGQPKLYELIRWAIKKESNG